MRANAGRHAPPLRAFAWAHCLSATQSCTAMVRIRGLCPDQPYRPPATGWKPAVPHGTL